MQKKQCFFQVIVSILQMRSYVIYISISTSIHGKILECWAYSVSYYIYEKLKLFMKMSENCACFAKILTSCAQYDIIFDVIILSEPNFANSSKWVIPHT